MSKYVLVTGANGGIGGAIVEELLKADYDVIACCRSKAIELNNPKLHIYRLDITDESAVEELYDKVVNQEKLTDNLYAIINVAGMMFMGSLLEEPTSRARMILETNVMGMYNINRVFFPLVQKGNGRIINFSSEYGAYTTVPFNAFYTMSKHAVESYSDGLRRELMFLGIPVVIIRPGAFKTKMSGSTATVFDDICNKTKLYPSVLKKMRPMMVDGTKNAKDVSVIAKVTMKAVTAKKPKKVYKSNHNFGVKMMSKFSKGMVDGIFYNMLKDKRK